MKSNSLVVVLLAFCLQLTAQDIGPKSFEYPFKVHVFDLPKASNGIQYRIYVREPLRPPEADEEAASFYFLDPLRLFVPAAAMSVNYEYFNYIPSAYFIGIGYSDEADGHPKTKNRTRDYTPTSFSPPNSTHFLASSPQDYKGSGGTDAFVKVLTDELIPFVETHYDMKDSDRVLIGKSLSGLAATHVLLSQPNLFDRYLIVSPSLWWDDWTYDRDQRYVMKAVARLDPDAFKRETRVYFAVGGEEDGFGMVTDLHVLVNALKRKRIDHLKVYLKVLDGEIHEGVFPAAFMKGILGLYTQEEKRRPAPTHVDWEGN